VANWGNSAALIAGLYSQDFELIGRSLRDDIFEPDRAPLIPGFGATKAAALKAGALGCSISGSGPSVFALCSSLAKAQEVAQAMKNAFSQNDLESEAFVSSINQAGAQIMGFDNDDHLHQ
jgi:homoserine kinase